MFEIGDKVIYQGADKSAYKREGTVKSIEDKNGKPQLTVELDGGETFTAPIDDWSRKFINAATHVSTNSVVANAMAANAKRAKNSKASEMVAKELIRLTTEARSIYNNIKRKVDEIKKAKAQMSALTLQVDSSVKKILDIAKEGELTIRALDENDPDWKEAAAAYQRFLHEMWDIKREIQ
ncbi:MAG: hypothetical protein IIZ06_09555 [Kiritimatiellae bacterium]|nr:hypothetical protein [Kiritimatiellia bacterium]